ncbi:MAG TPA: hypothetical protein VFF06_25195 [Polyangia bacterium]|nr:hypothetical protein [Polyangia bacterium]
MATTTRVGGAPMTSVAPARWSASLLSGLIAGEIGAVVMAVVMAIAYAAIFQNALGFTYPLNVIGAIRYGDVALVSLTPVGYLWALAFHLGVAAIWGLVFAVAATVLRCDKDRWAPIILGLAIGLAAQIVDVNIIGPGLLARLHGHDIWAEQVPPWVSWFSHVAFGLSFAAYGPIFRKLWLRFVGRDDLLARDPRLT